jgi:hypothetical protein
MKVIVNGVMKEVSVEPHDSVESFRLRISNDPIYVFAKQKRYVSSRQIYHSPSVKTTLLNMNIRAKEPGSYYELLEMELDGEREVWVALGVQLPRDVPVHPTYFQGTRSTAKKMNGMMSDYMPLEVVYAYTASRLPSDVYFPSDEVDIEKRPEGFVPSRANHDVHLSELFKTVHATKETPIVAYKETRRVYGEATMREYPHEGMTFDFGDATVTFHEDGSMITPERTPRVERLVERMNRLVQYGAPCRKTVYDVPTYGFDGVDWATFEPDPPKTVGPPFRHVDVKIKYRRLKFVEPHMSPFLACLGSILGISVATLKARLLRKVKRNTFPLACRGLLQHYFGTIHKPAYEDFLEYLKGDDRIDYTFLWEYVSRPGLFPNGANLLVYDAEREWLVFPSRHFSEIGYQDGATTVAMVKEGGHFSPIELTLKKEWYDDPTAPIMDPEAIEQVVWQGKTIGTLRHTGCMVPCRPTTPTMMEVVAYTEVRRLPAKETVAFLERVGAKPRYRRGEGVWTEAMLYVPCVGVPDLPLPELEAWQEYEPIKGVAPDRLERSRKRWVERRQHKAYRHLYKFYGKEVNDHIVVVDEIEAEAEYCNKKLIVLKRVMERVKEEMEWIHERCYLKGLQEKVENNLYDVDGERMVSLKKSVSSLIK